MFSIWLWLANHAAPQLSTSLTCAPKSFLRLKRIIWEMEERLEKFKVQIVLVWLSLKLINDSIFLSTDVGTKPEKLVIIGTDNGCAIFFRYEGRKNAESHFNAFLAKGTVLKRHFKFFFAFLTPFSLPRFSLSLLSYFSPFFPYIVPFKVLT